jgi:signal transduction histidine kinase
LLERRGVPEGGYADRVELVAAEIVTNAVRHVGGRIWVDVSADDNGATVAASDTAADPPTVGGADGGNGRGLLIVAALSDAWGSHDVPGGKRVWARVRR